MPKSRDELIEMMEALADEARAVGEFSAAIRAVQLAGLNHGLFVGSVLPPDDVTQMNDDELRAAVRKATG